MCYGCYLWEICGCWDVRLLEFGRVCLGYSVYVIWG